MQEEVGGRRQTSNRQEAGRRHETGKIRKKGACGRQEYVDRRMHEEVGGRRK